MEKNTKNKIIIIAAAAIGYFYYSSKQQLINSVSIVPTGIGTGGNLISPTLIIKLNAINPSNGSATVKSIAANINYQNNTIGSINMQTPFTIAPNATTSFSIPVQISDLGALSAIYQILISGTQISFDIIGNAQIDLFTLPLNITYTP